MKNIKIIVLFLFLLIIMKNTVFAKYYTNFNMLVSNKIAIPVIEISKEDDEDKTKKITATDGTEFVINVSNFNATNISQVGQAYYLKFYSDDLDISKLNITINKENNNIELKNGVTNLVYFNANHKETHRYNVNIKSNVNNETLKGMVKVKLINEQIKPC